MKEIATGRLILRRFQPGDVESAFQNFGSEVALGRFLPMYPLSSMEEMHQLLMEYMNANMENAWIYAIELVESRQIIGQVILDIPYPVLKVAELSYLLGPQFWGKGYAKEAVSAVIQEALSSEVLHLIEAKYNENNLASGFLLQKLGFKREARLRDRRIDVESGQWNDLIICSIMKDEISRIESGSVNKDDREVLLVNLDKLHTTEMGIERIKRNLGLEAEDVICWCRDEILKTDNMIMRRGKNWYIENDNCVITVNAYSYTVITAHKKKQ